MNLPVLIPELRPDIVFKALDFTCPVTSKPLRVFMINGGLWLAEDDLPAGWREAIRERFPATMSGWQSATVMPGDKSIALVSQHVAGFLRRLPQPAMRAFCFWLEEFVAPEAARYRMEVAA